MLQLGPKLLSNETKLGPSCASLKQRWATVGAVQVASKFGALLAKVGPKSRMLPPYRIETVHLEDVGPICKMCKFGWRLGCANMPPAG